MNEGLSFRLGNIPVTIGWWFFLLAYIIGPRNAPLSEQLMWVGVVLVSIIWHELGHATAFKFFGGSPAIKLYGMGGVCWDRKQNDFSPGKFFLISFAGPFFGFVIGVPLLLTVWLVPDLPPFMSSPLIKDLIWVNVGWSIFNLFPIFPLDGGQMLTSLFKMANLSVKWPAMISMLAAAALAAACFAIKQWYMAILFAMLFMSSMNLLNSADQKDNLGKEPWG